LPPKVLAPNSIFVFVVFVVFATAAAAAVVLVILRHGRPSCFTILPRRFKELIHTEPTVNSLDYSVSVSFSVVVDHQGAVVELRLTFL
jgi:hypothetical protein